MAIVLPQQFLGPFGGPAGATENAINNLMQGIMQGMEKKKREQQNQELSSMFSQQYGQPGNTPVGPNVTGVNQTAGDRAPLSGQEFANAILSNPNLGQDMKSRGIAYMSAINAMTPQAEKKTREIEYWKPDGSPGGKVLVNEANYNDAVEKIQKAGYIVNEPSKISGEFERILNRTDFPEKKKQAMMGKWIEKQVGEKPDKQAINEFSIFYRGFAGQHPELQGNDLDYEASKAWSERKIEEAARKKEEDFSDITQREIDLMGQMYNLTGQVPSLGRGNAQLRKEIVKSGARQALESQQGAADVVGGRADVKALGSSIQQQEKQIGAMGSFVRNLSAQVDRVGELAKDLQTFDTRLMNIPVRNLRQKITGSPLQSKYDMYLAEIESEIGKLSTGSSASIAELSQSAQEKWAKIHDKNLSVKDMLELLQETKHAGQMRMKSVQDQLEETRQRIRKTGGKMGEYNPVKTSTDYLKKFGVQ